MHYNLKLIEQWPSTKRKLKTQAILALFFFALLLLSFGCIFSISFCWSIGTLENVNLNLSFTHVSLNCNVALNGRYFCLHHQTTDIHEKIPISFLIFICHFWFWFLTWWYLIFMCLFVPAEPKAVSSARATTAINDQTAWESTFLEFEAPSASPVSRTNAINSEFVSVCSFWLFVFFVGRQGSKGWRFDSRQVRVWI